MPSEKEKSAHEAYKKFLDIMLYDVPLKQLDDLVVNDVTGYGTTLDEKILEIERLRKLVIDQREQGAGYEMNFVINPVHRRINPDNGLAVFIDEIEISMNINGDKNIIPLRFSSVLELTNDSWKVVHLHGSVAVNTEGDTWHKEEHLRKIEELEKLVFEKTEDLVKKNCELEIETSLERVRTVAMGMNKSDDLLSICEVSFKEFKKLGFDNLRNAIIHILNDEKGFFLDYDYSDYLGGSINHINYNSHPVVEDYLRQIKRADDAFAQVVIEGTELDDWKEFRRSGGQVDDPKLDGIQSLYYYLFSIGIGDIGISTFSPIDDTQIKILKRFRNVFDLAYRRYNDIALAEVQAREAQIELALERVRARTMAMQKSDELKEVIQLVYEQFVHLNVLVEHAGFIMDYKARDDMHIWLADKHEVPSEITIPYFDSPHWNSFIEAKEKGMDFFANHLDFEEKNKFYRDLFKLFPVADDAKKYYLSCPGLAISTVLLENIGLYIENFSGIPYTDEENNTLMRFGKVFQQTYTRFLDLQRAEAQAREAQIELALERVRARAMAMQKSDELLEVGALLYQGLFKLGIQNLTCGYVLMDQEKKIGWNYGVNPGDGTIKPQPTGIPQSGTKILQLLTESWEKQEPFLLFKLDPQETINHQTYIAENCINFPFSAEKLLSISPERLVIHTFNFKQGYLLIVGGIVLTTQQQEMVIRFAKVFEQTYTRFLDLQKAEAQSREAQIELALERIRARTMAMQKSDELSETARVLFQQFKELGEDPDQLSIGIVNESEKVIEIWLSLQGNIMNRMFKAPIDEPTVINKIYTAWKEKRKSVVIDISGEELERYNRYINSDVDFKEYNDVKNRIGTEEHRRIIYAALFSKGLLSVATQEPRSEETIKILERFAGVFDGTYTRFLDLQKAEAQAKEAQIEAALERVRSKAMSMYSSEDLAVTVDTFFSELNTLNVMPHRCGVGIINANTRIVDINATTATHENVLKKITGKLKLYGHPVLDGIFENWKLQTEYHPVLKGKEILDYYKVMNPQIEFPDFAKDETQYGYYFFFKEGGVFVWSETELSENDLQIFRRFTSVLSLTHRRYLDLKEAEEQTREAQIEVALERVRSRTMSMHQSDELAETAAVVFKQLINLGIEPNRIYITIIKDETGTCEFWITDEDGSKVSSVLRTNLNENFSFKKMYVGWKQNRKSITIDMQGEELQEYFKHLSSLNVPFREGPSQKRRLQYISYFSNGFIGVASTDETKPETLQLLERFAAVFNLAYTRFNDLKQAEAQNKIIQADNDRKTKELEDARQLQLSMLPKALPQIPNLDIAVYMKTATEVGGDYYDFNVDENGTLTVVVGDATGHGMMSGMMVSIIKSFFISNRSSIDLKEFFENTNNSLKEMQLGRLMMPLIGVQITSEKIIATNAGMPSLLYFRNKSQKAGEFVSNNLPLGGMKGTKFLLKAVKYEKGDTILLMSDGFAELKNSQNEQYGYTRTKEKFKSLVKKSSGEIIEELKTTASEWTNGAEPDDDVTFVVIKFQ